MGNLGSNDNVNCKQRCGELLNETKTQIERYNPFSNISSQLPYAQPLESNIYAPKLSMQKVFDKIIDSQPIKVPVQFERDESYEYDEKYWKKQQPNIIIQGNWYKRKPHGLCKIYFPNGQIVFVSYFNHGSPLYGDCLVIFQNGSYYHGPLRNFKFDGPGRYVHFDKNVVIEGEWKNGHPVGKVKEKIIFEDQSIQFDGQFNQQSQKQGQRCTYQIKSRQKQAKSLFEYQGGFRNDSFFGQGSIKTNNGLYKMTGVFKNDNVDVQKIETGEFQFTGKLDKLLNEGTGKVNIKGARQKIICQGPIKEGMLNGPGTVTEDGEIQKVHWFNGIKIKHIRNYDNPSHISQLLQRIEMYYSTSKTYTELTKQLQQYFKGHKMVEGLSPRKQCSCIFEMITKQKTNVITSSTRSIIDGSNTQGSGLKTPNKRQLIIQLQKGKFLYVSCYSRGRQ